MLKRRHLQSKETVIIMKYKLYERFNHIGVTGWEFTYNEVNAQLDKHTDGSRVRTSHQDIEFWEPEEEIVGGRAKWGHTHENEVVLNTYWFREQPSS